MINSKKRWLWLGGIFLFPSRSSPSSAFRERLKPEHSTNSYDPKTGATLVPKAGMRGPGDIVFSIGVIILALFMVRLLTGVRAHRPAPRLATVQRAE
ncbi:MAG TPA: hypothetical protein PKD99_00235 [Sphingopyxis sp.]|mgnify:CR=1 FL=1|nr:hypothetical protein [Sphingopyxis sp.]HMP43502.1 hypothetical protein [Sphingopyxis sp.]